MWVAVAASIQFNTCCTCDTARNLNQSNHTMASRWAHAESLASPTKLPPPSPGRDMLFAALSGRNHSSHNNNNSRGPSKLAAPRSPSPTFAAAAAAAERVTPSPTASYVLSAGLSQFPASPAGAPHRARPVSPIDLNAAAAAIGMPDSAAVAPPAPSPARASGAQPSAFDNELETILTQLDGAASGIESGSLAQVQSALAAQVTVLTRYGPSKHTRTHPPHPHLLCLPGGVATSGQTPAS